MTQQCAVPLSLGKPYTDEVLWDVLNIDHFHVAGRSNTMLMPCMMAMAVPTRSRSPGTGQRSSCYHEIFPPVQPGEKHIVVCESTKALALRQSKALEHELERNDVEHLKAIEKFYASRLLG